MNEKKDVGYMWRIGTQTADGVSTDITGNFPVDASDDVINATLDRFHHIFDRQRAKSLLADEENTLAKEKASLESMRESLLKNSEKERTTSAERQNIEALKRSITEFEARIANREAGIESLKKLI